MDDALKFKLYLIDAKGAKKVYPINLSFEKNKKENEVSRSDEKSSKNNFKSMIVGKISKISIFGEMEVWFNSTLFQQMNKRHINESIVDIYLDPYDR